MKLKIFLTLVFFTLSPLSASASDRMSDDMKNQLVEALQKFVIFESNFLEAVEAPVTSTFHPMGIKLKKVNGEDLTTYIRGTLYGIAKSVSSKTEDSDIINKGWKPLQGQQKKFLHAIIQKVTSLWETKSDRVERAKENIQRELNELYGLQKELETIGQDFTLNNIQAYHALFMKAQNHYNSAVTQFQRK